MEKICQYCGTQFVTTNKNRLYCSIRCRSKAEVKRKKERIRTRTALCAYCGNPFHKLPANKKYCSFHCASESYKQKAKEKRGNPTRATKQVLTKTCAQCGEPYATKDQNQQFCSRICARKHAAMKLQEYNQQRKRRTFPITPGICPVCGTTLGAKAIEGKYCSVECHDLVKFYQKAKHDDVESMEAINKQLERLESQQETLPKWDYLAERSNYLYKKISLIQRVLKRQ